MKSLINNNLFKAAGGTRGLGVVLTSAVVGVALAFFIDQPQAQVAVGQDLNPPVFPLNRTAVPDVNRLGLLDKTGANASAWPKITNPNQKDNLVAMGKALFWDMQVGGDGVQACATCHYHGGADHRITNQISPGIKSGDFAHDLSVNPNGTLQRVHYTATNNPNRGLAVSEAALIAGLSTADLADGTPGTRGTKPSANDDVNEVVSSQGVRLGTHAGVNLTRVDNATLATSDTGFNVSFTNPATGIPNTARRVEPRNAPTILNAIYNFRNFHDGRADMFFNGVSPLGFRDPNARVKTRTGDERLNIPFSSLASQAVGPIGSDFEMVFSGRAHRDLGKKLVGAKPLAGQLVAINDSVLGGLADGSMSNRGLSGTYGDMINAIFDQRFRSDTRCLNPDGSFNSTTTTTTTCPTNTYSLTQYNFALFFGLAVQAYEATLFTDETIVDLIVGGKATGTLTNGAGLDRKVVNVAGLPLDVCIARLALNTSAAQQAIATNMCTAHYAKFIHPGAKTGTESNNNPNPVAADAAIGGCATPTGTGACAASPNLTNARSTLLNVSRGMGRFFAGATACAVCHFNPEFTGATIQAMTGFGAGPIGVLPPGQVRRLVENPVVMERMIAFNGLPTVYDAGFYNLGIRPTPEDISLGDKIGGVPLAYAKLAQIIAGGNTDTSFNQADITLIANSLSSGSLKIPTSPTNLTPLPFNLNIACGPGINALNAQSIPQACPPVTPVERLLRNGAFKAQGLRNVKFTGPYFHNGSKMNLRQVLEFYKTSGHFTNLNFNNLDAGLRVFNLGAADEASVVEFMETGLTDWRVAYEEGKFDHPEICIPHGHDAASGKTKLVGIPAVGKTGNASRLQTFEEHLSSTSHVHNLTDACTVTGISTAGFSDIDIPPR